MNRQEAIRLLDVLHSSTTTDEQKQSAYERLCELFIVLLPE